MWLEFIFTSRGTHLKKDALPNKLNGWLPQVFRKDVFIPRASCKERGIKLIEEKVKPAFKKIHDYYFNVSKDNPMKEVFSRCMTDSSSVSLLSWT